MPVTPTYPGVYIQEVSSGVKTISGISTAITAFIGSAKFGPVNEPTTIFNYGDFERGFGGLFEKSTMSFAVRDFFMNGGGQATIVRVTGAGATKATIELGTVPGSIGLEAINEGAWGKNLRAIAVPVETKFSGDMATKLGVTTGDLFTLIVQDTARNIIETFRSVTVKESANRIDRVLKKSSQLVRVATSISDTTPIPAVVADPWNTASDILWKKAGVAVDGVTISLDEIEGSESNKTGIYALEKVDLFNILCIPPYDFETSIDSDVWTKAAAYCEKRRAFLLVDAPFEWTTPKLASDGITTGVGTTSKNSALFFPAICQPNPFRGNLVEPFAPCGAVAGVMARTDGERGLWKAAAGLEATIAAPALSVNLTDNENGLLNPLGINCLRNKPPAGRIIWGARTLQGDDRLASEWKYVPVRRLALYIEECLFRGTQWVVFEPNDEPLWSQIRLNLGAFMHGLFRQGAFQGASPKEAYFVKCSSETTTQADINNGIVNIEVGFAPLKPAEFVILKLQQMAGKIDV